MANLIRKIAQSASKQTTRMIISSNDSATNRYLGFDAGESSVFALTYLNGELHDLKKRVEKLEERPLIYTTRLNDLLTERYILSHPVDIVIEKYDDEYIAKSAELEIFGSGTTESESIINLKKEIVHLYEDLVASDVSELGALPAMWKRILLKMIVSCK